MRSFYVTVRDFIYETVPSNHPIVVYDNGMKNHGEVIFQGTPDDLFDNNKLLADDLTTWTVDEVSANNDVLEIGCFQR